MTRTLISAFAFASLFLPVLSGPACAKKYQNSPECMALCKPGNNWGFKDPKDQEGMYIGIHGNLRVDPWGIVLTKSGKSMDDWIAAACGAAASPSSAAPSSTSSEAPKFTIAGGAVDNESTTSSSSTTSTTSSTPSSTSTTSSTSSTPPPKPTTTSTPPPKPTTSSTPPPPPPPPTTSSKEPEPTPEPEQKSSGGGGGGSSDSEREQWLSLHNSLRAKHGAGDLTWSDAAEAAAKTWANKCVFEHSGGSVGPFGENLAAGTGASYGPADAFKSWADEESEYNPGSPKASHYTQVVWKASTQVGCALAPACKGIFGGSETSRYYVCEYSEQGNVIGAFGENVQ
ncbi:PR-1-like protein [Flagelloscypha sp. PMI_526]|nr:PR-1-like protein [Flagelloscypha sp. PMI_526]